MSKYIVGITGASGSIYAVRLVEELVKLGNEVLLVVTDCGKEVLQYELGESIENIIERYKEYSGKISIYDNNDFFAPIASGSYCVDGMVILPCTMTTLAKAANGIADNLLNRAADVCMKERRKLILVPRETPFNTIHLQNMLRLSEAGAVILPAMPNFYHKPTTIEEIVDTVVGRVLKSLEINNSLYAEWNGGI